MNREIEVTFMPNTKDVFLKHINIEFKESKYNEFFNEELSNFNDKLLLIQTFENSKIKDIWNIITPFISGYLIKESYYKLNYNRINNFYLNPRKSNCITFNEDDYIELRKLGTGSTFCVCLVYHIVHEKLYAIKKTYTANNENEKLINRETKNYQKNIASFYLQFLWSNEY